MTNPSWTYEAVKNYKDNEISYYDLCDLFKCDYGKLRQLRLI